MRILYAALIGLGLGALFITVTGYNAWEAYRTMFVEAAGTPVAWADVLGKATPLVLLGLGVTIAFRAGLFNIGGEGQFTVGALAASALGHALSGWPAFLLIPALFISGALAGGLWAGLAGWMKAKRNVHEVVSTIMLNYIALGLGTYLINIRYGPLHDSSAMNPQSLPIGSGGILPTLVSRTDLHAGVFLAMLFVPVAAWILRKSVFGYEIRLVGLNPIAAKTYGINEGSVIWRTMAFSGALAGLAGAMELMGIYPYLFKNGFSAGRGFDAITIALMGGGSPLGTLFAALFLGALRLGSSGMETITGVPNELSLVLQGILIIAVTAPALANLKLFRRRAPEQNPNAIEAGGAS